MVGTATSGTGRSQAAAKACNSWKSRAFEWIRTASAPASAYALARRSGTAASVEERIAPLEEVYALVGVPELRANEQRFLFAGDEAPRAVILAAGFEPQLLPLIKDRPKAMLEVKGRTILERQVGALRHCGVRDVVVVRGYKKERVSLSW